MEIIKYRGTKNFICILCKHDKKLLVGYGLIGTIEIDTKELKQDVIADNGVKIFQFTCSCSAEFKAIFKSINDKLFHFIYINNENEYNTIYNVLESIYE